MSRIITAALLAIMLLAAFTACANPAATTPGQTQTPSPTLSPTVPVSTTPRATPTPTPTATTPAGAALSQFQASYRLLDKYSDFFWCDPDFFPIGRPGGEETNAAAQFATIRANTAEFSAILERLGLPSKADYTAEEQLSIYREHKKLTRALQITPSGNAYQFVVRTGQNQGFRLEGTISTAGAITESKMETSFNTCPICLAKGTLIDTPAGPIAVEQVQVGMTIWTADGSGARTAAKVIKTSRTAVPADFQVVRLILADGRTVTASPGHPTAEMRGLGEYQARDRLDGATVISAERVEYGEEATYDILPSGESGTYWANGVQLLSTLK